jgi:Plasmid pRiA4b ORF-3-like protein
LAAKKNRAVYQLKISLRDIHPAVWRRIQVWEETKLSQLHRILQLILNWEDYHVHQFVVGRRFYAEPDPEDNWFGRKVIDERHVTLRSLASRVGAEFQYVYDLGDNWRHDVLLEAILLPEEDVFYPRCVAGARNGPPEDAGGVCGYARYLEALADPEHEEHETLLQWRGPFNPEAFSLKHINASLKRTFHRRSAQSSRTGEEATQKMVRILQYGGREADSRKRIAPGSTLLLELNERERELILEHSFADDDLTRRLRLVPQPGKRPVYRFTLGELDELGGCVAFEANHAKQSKLKKEWERLFDKITAILNTHTDE